MPASKKVYLLEKEREHLKTARRIVVKVGSGILVQKNGRPDLNRIDAIIRQLAEQFHAGKEVLLVSSGAIAAGLEVLGMKSRPNNIPELQMAASIGQVRLMTEYDKQFTKEGCKIGQVLLTHDDLRNRARHLNARNTIQSLLREGLIPIVNENDVVSVDEIKFGDNDILAALVSILIGADVLILLTSTEGLKDFRASEQGMRVPYLETVTQEALTLVNGRGGLFSMGGMSSKLQSAQKAVENGVQVVIADGREENIIPDILAGKDVGTLIGSRKRRTANIMNSRKRWIAFFHRPTGTIFIDDGARKAIIENNVSLLPIGVCKIEGKFTKGSLVNIKSTDGQLIAKGLVDYSDEQLQKIKGCPTRDIAKILGSKDYDEVIHRENMVVLSANLEN